MLRQSARASGTHRLLTTAVSVMVTATVSAAAGCGGSSELSTGPTGTTSSSTNTGGSAGSTSVGGSTSTSSSSAGGTSSTSAGGATTTTSTTGTGSDKPPFQLIVHTALAPGNALALTTSLPALVADCLSEPFADTPCADLDQDGLADAWEQLVIDRYRPLLRFDEQESLLDDATAVTADVARVALVSPSPLRVRVFIMLGYSKDYGSCGFTAHDGDSERVAIDLAAPENAAPGDVTTLAMYTAAHEGTANDHGKIFEGAALAQLVFTPDPTTTEPRWVVFPSQDKHGTYATIAICENISVVPCLDEDCAPDGVAEPATFDRLPPFVNAGEEAHPLVSDLTAIGFPGDDAWSNDDFCGGLGGATCSAPVREKLLVDPFTP